MQRSLRRPRPTLSSLVPGTFLVALAAVLVAGCASTSRRETPKVTLEFEKYTLPNGLDVILRKDSRLPIVGVNLWYHVGPANETAGRTGFAHLFEHMMFQGSGHVGPDRYFAYLEGAGASFVNGTTDFDRTNYMEDLPSNQLELALWLESDRMGFLLDQLDQAMLSNQQDVVRNERRQSIENAPYVLAEESMYQLLFPSGHPYHAMVIGSHQDIQAAKLEDVRDFFSRYYAPNNASLAIVGDIDVAKTKALVEKYFGSIPRGADVPAVQVETPPVTEERRTAVTDRVELPRVYMAWLTPTIFKPGDAEADFAARILGQGKASRLYKSLVYDKKIAQDVSAVQQSLTLGSVFQITATAKPGHTAEELEQAIQHEVDSLAAAGPSADELGAARNTIHASIIKSLEQIGSFGGVADRLNYYNHHLEDPGYLNRDLERYSNVTTDGVKKLVADHLGATKRVVVHCNPGEKVIPEGPPTPPPPAATAAAVASQEPWRNQVPKPGELSTAPLPSARQFKLANGLTVFLVESHDLPVVSASLVLRSGGAADPPHQPGLAGFTMAMLDEGTSRRDALTIARDLEAIGASLGTDVSKDGASVSAQSLKPHAKDALQIMADVALTPTFPENEVERVRNDRLTSVQQDRDSPTRIAYKLLWREMYGETHPYNHLVIGSEAALRQISRADLEAFYK